VLPLRPTKVHGKRFSRGIDRRAIDDNNIADRFLMSFFNHTTFHSSARATAHFA